MRGTVLKFLRYLYRNDLHNLQQAKNSWQSFSHVDKGKMFPNSKKFWKLSQKVGDSAAMMAERERRTA